MTLDVFKAQARRLQAFLRSNPTQAAGLIEGKHASCLEAVAAVHGARNWNTLQAGASHPGVSRASASATPAGVAGEAPPDLNAAMGGMYPGQVLHLRTGGPGAKSLALKFDIAHAVFEGYRVTLLEVGNGFHHLAHALDGFSTTFGQAHMRSAISRSPVVCFDFQGWLLTNMVLGDVAQPIPKRWEQGVAYVQERTGRDCVLVLDRITKLQSIMGEHFKLMLQLLVEARRCGSIVVVVAESDAELDLVSAVLPADLTVVGPR